MGKKNRGKRDAKRPPSTAPRTAPVVVRVLPAVVAGVVLAVLVGLVYGNAVHPGVVHDDRFFFPGDDAPAPSEWGRYFAEDTWAPAGITSGVFRPLLMVTIAVDGALYGGDAAGYHRTNVALHALFTVLLFAFLYAVLREGTEEGGTSGWRSPALLGAWIGAAVFALDPMNTEAVCSIFNRSEMLAAIGVFSALLVVWRFERRHPYGAWAAAAFVYGVSLLFKESAATLPMLAVLMVAIFRPTPGVKGTARRLAPALLLLFPLAGYLALRVSALGGLTGEAGGAPFASRAVVALSSLGELLRMVLFPYPNRASYADFEPTHAALFAAVHVALIVGAVVAHKRRQPFALFGIAFFYIAAIPSSRLMTTSAVAVPLAERYLYLPAAGLTVALARLATRGLYGGAAPVTIAAAAILLALFGYRSHERNEDWHSNLALFEAEYAAAPDSGETLRLLTGAYLGRRDYAAVAKICDKHLAEHPRHAKLNNHCGAAYVNLKRYPEAEAAYRVACSTDEIGSVPHVNLARLYLKMGRFDDAKAAFEKGIAVEDNPARKHYRRGHMLTRLYPRDRQKLRLAKAEFEAALALQPGLGVARTWLNRVNRSLGGAGREDAAP